MPLVQMDQIMDETLSQMKKIIEDVLALCPDVGIDIDFVTQHVIEAMKATYGSDLTKCSFIEIKNVAALCYKMFCYGRVVQNKLIKK